MQVFASSSLKLTRWLIVVAIALLVPKLAVLIPWSFQVAIASRLTAESVTPCSASFDIVQIHDQAALGVALASLSVAQNLQPEKLLPYRLASKIYTAQGNWEHSKDLYNQAKSYTDDWALRREAAIFALYWLGFQPDTLHLSELPPYILTAVQDIAPNERSLRQLGDSLLFCPQPAVARGAYRLASMLYGNEAKSFSVRFRDLALSIMTHQLSAQASLTEIENQYPPVIAYSPTISKSIPGGAFYWLTPVMPPAVTYGSPLNYPYGGDNGIFWWNGDAVAILAIQQDNDYLVCLNVRNSAPPPVEMAYGMDGTQSGNVSLITGDNSWETISFTVPLKTGLHTFNLWYLNNETVGKKDRDAALHSFNIQPVTHDLQLHNRCPN